MSVIGFYYIPLKNLFTVLVLQSGVLADSIRNNHETIVTFRNHDKRVAVRGENQGCLSTLALSLVNVTFEKVSFYPVTALESLPAKQNLPHFNLPPFPSIQSAFQASIFMFVKISLASL